MRTFYGDLFNFHREFNEMFNRILTGKPLAEWPELPTFNKEFNFLPAVETYVDKQTNKYVCRVTLPGIEPKELEVFAKGNLLTIRGERKFHHGVKEVELMENEFAYGKFERVITLPEGVVGEKLTAEYANCVLEITAPFVVAALPKKIEIKTTAPFVKQVTA